MITTIIFSKNRAMQLDCLLTSLNDHTGGLFRKYVLYTYSNDKFKEGYDYMKQFHPNVSFILEDRMKHQIISLLTGYYSCFMVDDQIMFKDAPRIPELNHKQCFALRLGKNIGEPHISYPMSVDGNIFRTEDIKTLIETTNFANPNTLEKKLQKHKNGWDLSYSYQCMVSVPHNRVSDKSHCAFSGEYTAEVLNDYLLDGYVIDYRKMDFSNLDNVHKTIPYAFRTR